jgi:hypothetical protein
VLSEIIVGIVSATLTAPLAAWLALRRFYSERWWERKLDAYTVLIESLHHMGRPYDEALEAEIDGRQLSKEFKETLNKKSSEAYAEVLKQLDMSEFIISREAADVLRNALRKADEANTHSDYTQYIFAKQNALVEAITQLKAAAKRDLRLGRRLSVRGMKRS